ncbi:85/88 kDa calcium-independent phospholipase A2 isoform X1 [Drosophila bipectinata]|uniref:85/88 kDa calcium-independent phospholipase A2 isoform X1 n=1 Tax=Drosophila bipectinata TaxID=42026 RepID=UPI001C893951|nr:85/88 kDa calcium-independent phospholipase A2 isoform X1 [Drosophila bipectinata]
MSWITFGALASGFVLQRLLGGDQPANKVLEIKSESLGTLQVLARDDAMVLFAPPYNSNDKRAVYEIVLQRPTSDSNTTSFSLYRSAVQSEAEERFNAFRQRLPVFVSIVKEHYNINGLQKTCDALADNPSWTLAHLVAYFNLVDYISNPKVLQCIDQADHTSLMSPFQLAIKQGHIEMVKALLPLSKLEHLDINSNSVFHYAASTTKEIINLLTDNSTVNLNHINSDGYTPLHIACVGDKPDCVKALLLAGADVNLNAKNITKLHKTSAPTSVASFLKTNVSKLYTQDMKYGGTPLHWCSSRETLHALIMEGCDVNATNFEGRTALHVMVARNRFECVVTLLAHDADIDVLDQEGNAALHIAIEKKLVPIVQCLVVFGCDINLKNKDGRTPRHMVGNDTSGNKEDEILYILHSVGAKRCTDTGSKCPPGCNAKGNYNGIPPEAPESVEQREHIENMLATTSRQVMGGLLGAAANGLIEKQPPPQMPVVVDTEKELKGQSIMDALLGMFTTKVNADEMKKDTSSGSLASATATPPSASPEQLPSPTSPIAAEVGDKPYGRGRLLCLDGGGIRGLVLVQMLLEIEKLSRTPIIHMFDWIAGTSTGGILALGLGCGKTMRQCMGLYLRMKEQCFVGSRPYNSEFFESILKDNLGEFNVMTDIKHPKIMVTGVMADRKPVDLHLFRNYTSASDILGIVTSISNRRIPPPPPQEQLVWRAARATGAAPSYFRAFGRFLDGGLIANNPTLDAMTEIHEYNMALRSVGRESEAIPVSVVVSLGTGHIPVTELKDIDVFRPESIWDTAKLAYGISTIGNLLVDQATCSDGRVVDRARAWCSTIGIPYFRFNPQLSEDIAMDEKNDQKLINMLWHTKAYMHNNRNKIIEMINFLK